MRKKLNDFFEWFFVVSAAIFMLVAGIISAFVLVVGSFLFVLICQPFFWLAVIATVLIVNLL